MTDAKLQGLIKEFLKIKKEIIDKLEEIRCGVIDVEDEIIKLRKTTEKKEGHNA